MSVKQKETVRIDGMSCGHCVKAVEAALEDLENVEVHHVEIGAATISYDPDVVAPDRIAQAIEDEGYQVVG